VSSGAAYCDLDGSVVVTGSPPWDVRFDGHDSAMQRTDRDAVARAVHAFRLPYCEGIAWQIRSRSRVDNLFDRQIADWPGFTGRHIDTSIFWRADAR
jgi:hypothetical protein